MSTSIPELTPSQLNYSSTAAAKELVKHALIDLRVATPAIVTAFDAGRQVVSVQILTSELVRTPTGPVWTAIAPINNVPILLPRAGGFSLTLPIVPGDEGLLVFCDTCLDLWWQQGGQQPPPGAPLAQPNFERTRRHDLTDCGFFPGIWNQKRVLANYSPNSAQLRSDDDSVIVDVALAGITLTGPNVTINSTGDVDINATGIVKIQSAGDNSEIDGQIFLQHLHTGVQVGGANSGPVL
jgi:hypothetical protein